MKSHLRRGDSQLTLCGKAGQSYAEGLAVNAPSSCRACLKAHAKKNRKSVSASHPGTAEVAKAAGLGEEVIRALAGAKGCPLVKGGRGYRFVSVEAFTKWALELPLETRLRVKPWARQLKHEVIEEIAKLTWGADSEALQRKSHGELLALLAEWEQRDAEDVKRTGKPFRVKIGG
jgi:hypothetical protein